MPGFEPHRPLRISPLCERLFRLEAAAATRMSRECQSPSGPPRRLAYPSPELNFSRALLRERTELSSGLATDVDLSEALTFGRVTGSALLPLQRSRAAVCGRAPARNSSVAVVSIPS